MIGRHPPGESCPDCCVRVLDHDTGLVTWLHGREMLIGSRFDRVDVLWAVVPLNVPAEWLAHLEQKVMPDGRVATWP